MHTIHAWIPIALLAVGPRRVNKILGYSVEIQGQQALQTMYEILAHLLKPLFNARCQTGYEIICANGNIHLSFPKLFC